MVILRFIIPVIILFNLNIILYAQSLSMKGQIWTSILTTNDIPIGQSSLENNIGYIPTFSLYKALKGNYLIDMELGLQLNRTYSGESLINNTESFHRYWIRYSSEKIEARLGLQKIAFGPSRVLRSLSWFDTFNLKDPTGQTDGVKAFRIMWFPFSSLSVWSWIIMNDQDTLSYGGRTEFSTNNAEWGLTFHKDPSSTPQQTGHSNSFIASPHQRIALDYRYDGFVGLWNESAMISSEDLEIGMLTAGIDYTLPIINSVPVMFESTHILKKENDIRSSSTSTAFMASITLSMINQVMFISNMDWDENHIYNYLRWSSVYDYYSFNFILSMSPKRKDYSMPLEFLPKTLAGFGDGIQVMFIYNH